MKNESFNGFGRVRTIRMQAEEECTSFFSFNCKNIFLYVRVDFRIQFRILTIIKLGKPLSEKETKIKSVIAVETEYLYRMGKRKPRKGLMKGRFDKV